MPDDQGRADGIDDDALRSIASHAIAQKVRFGYEGAGGLLHRHPARLSLHACDLLTDDADWNAETWDMSPEASAELADAFDLVLDRSRNGMVASALWDGDSAAGTQTLDRRAFIEIVRGGRLGTKTRYAVQPSRDIGGR